MNPLSIVNGAPAGSGAGTGSLALPLLAFVAVVALIPLVLWLARRLPQGLGGQRRQAACPMRVVSTLALAPNQRLVTVEVGQDDERRWLVLGVTAAGIQTLHALTPAPTTVADSQPASQPARPPGPGQQRVEPGFAQMLGAVRQAQQGSGPGPGQSPGHPGHPGSQPLPPWPPQPNRGRRHDR